MRRNYRPPEPSSGSSRSHSRNPLGLTGKALAQYYKELNQKSQREAKLARTHGLSLENSEESSYQGPSSGSSRPPRGLTGRELGMYYKQKNQKAQKEEKFKGGSVSLTPEKFDEIKNLIGHSTNNTSFTQNLNRLIHDESIESEFKDKYLKIISINFENHLIESLQSAAQYDNDDESYNLSEKIFDEWQVKIENTNYQTMQEYRKQLPTYNHRDEILDTIDSNQVVVISGDTGCGKTTQVSQFILDHFIETKRGAKCRIICTQPRRISAITIAERVALERHERLGDSVGYQIRLDSRLPRSDGGSIVYCTGGILLKLMETNKALLGYSHIILDEIHERDTTSDITIGIIKKILPYRKDLKIILMSATMRAEIFSRYFNNCPVIKIEGNTFPVQTLYLEDALEEVQFFNFPQAKVYNAIWKKHANKRKDESEAYNFSSFMEPYLRSVENTYSRNVINALRNPESEKFSVDLVEALIFHISTRKPPGAILVFIPGYDQISKLFQFMKDNNRYPSNRFDIYTLHSMMPGIDQKQVFIPSQYGKRKIILATNIAETSITINDVVYVIDTGKRKITSYDAVTNIQSLEEQWVSLANATQRKGRAGRVQPGVCYHLFSRAREYTLSQYPIPEILCQRLEDSILKLKILCLGDVSSFLSTLIDVPETATIEKSINLLKRMDALDENENLTPLGLHLAQMPVTPQLGKLILMGSIFSCIDPITSVAACLSFKEPFYHPIGETMKVERAKLNLSKETRSDHLMLANAIKGWQKSVEDGYSKNFCYDNFLSQSILQQLNQMKKQFCENLYNTQFLESADPKDLNGNINSDNKKMLKAIICSGLYPNIAKIRNIKNKAYVKVNIATPEDKKVQVHPSSVNAKQAKFESQYLVYNTKQKTSALYLYDTTMVNPYSILFFGDMLQVYMERDTQYISVGGNFTFKCNDMTANLIKELKDGLNLILQKKICQPSAIDWHGDEGKILRAIIFLISTDGEPEYSEDDDDDGYDY